MKKWKKISLLSTAVILVGALSACSSSSGSSSRNPSFSLPVDISTLDQSLVTDQYSYTIVGTTQEGLTRVDSSGQPANALAKSIDVSKDGLTYTVVLRDGLKWSNGDALTAKDFVYSWQRGVNPDTASQYAYLMGVVKNANDINSGKITDLSQLGIKAESSTKLVITLEAPTPYFKYLLGQAIFMPENQKVVEKYGKQYGTSSDKMVYNGPFKFTSKNPWSGNNKSFSVVKNPAYYDASSVKASGLDFQTISQPTTAVALYKQGKLDLAFLTTPSLVSANKSNAGFKTFVQARTDYIEYNQTGKVKALTNQKIREALNLATDRKGAINVATPGSKVASSLSPSGLAKTPTGEDFATYAKQGYTYDPAKAKTLFAEGLKELGVTSLSLSFEYASDQPVATAFATYLQQSLQSNLPGLKLSLKGVPFKQRLNDQQVANFDIVLASWGGDYAEPSTFLQMFLTGGSYNDGKFSSKEFDTAYQKASTTPDVLNPTALYEDYKACETALYQGSYINPVDFQSSPALLNPKIQGLQFVSTGLNYDFKNVELKK
ncbi:MAG: peptide ABC transporter substrate-binding protein [Streptococcaceae bacterium]|nr:peptide ABC transporter substrate-binding protein [Streptococcaceae bacterium]